MASTPHPVSRPSCYKAIGAISPTHDPEKEKADAAGRLDLVAGVPAEPIQYPQDATLRARAKFFSEGDQRGVKRLCVHLRTGPPDALSRPWVDESHHMAPAVAGADHRDGRLPRLAQTFRRIGPGPTRCSSSARRSTPAPACVPAARSISRGSPCWKTLLDSCVGILVRGPRPMRRRVSLSHSPSLAALPPAYQGLRSYRAPCAAAPGFSFRG